MKKLLRGVGRLVSFLLIMLFLTGVTSFLSPASASEPATITCELDVIIDPDTGVHTLVTILTIEHDGEVAKVILKQPPEGPLSNCRFR